MFLAWFEPWLLLTGLISVRLGVMFVLLPAPFGSVSPRTVRAGLTVLLAVVLNGSVLDAASIPLMAAPLAGAAFGEAVIGTVIGLAARVTLAAAEMAGTFAGFSMGLGFANSVDPMFGENALPTTRLVGSFAAFVFFGLEGHHVVLSALAATLHAAPPGNALGAVRAEGVIQLGAGMISQGLRIASPVVATLFIIQVGMGLVSRAAPKVQIFSLSFAVASGCGLFSLYFTAPAIAISIAAEIDRIPTQVLRVLGQ